MKSHTLLRRLREERDLSRQGLAEEVGTTASVVLNLEAGITRTAKPAVREKLEETFGLPLSALLAEDKRPLPAKLKAAGSPTLLKTLLWEQRLTYRAAGRLFGCSRETVRVAALGRYLPMPDVRRRMVEYFETPAERLFAPQNAEARPEGRATGVQMNTRSEVAEKEPVR